MSSLTTSYWSAASCCATSTRPRFVIGNYDEVLSSGKGLNVNVMSGMVTGDSLMFGSFLTGASALNPAVTDPTTVKDYEKAAKDKLDELADQFLACYPAATDGGVAAAIVASNVDVNNAMQLLNAKERKENGNANVFVYHFSHVMPGPEAEAMGALHTADVPYFINHFSEARAEYWTDVDYALGDAMSDYLVNFATKGDVNGSTVPAWNAYAGEGDYSYMELGDEIAL